MPLFLELLEKINKKVKEKIKVQYNITVKVIFVRPSINKDKTERMIVLRNLKHYSLLLIKKLQEGFTN